MNYEKTYSMLIETRKNRELYPTEYYEKHHIWPKSLGGTDEKWNIVHLTAREHYLAHWLLYKMADNKNERIKMGYAFSILCWNKEGQRITGRIYEYAKKAKIYAMQNRYVSDLTREKLSESRMGKKNPMYGLTGTKCPNYGLTRSKGVRKRIGQSQKTRFKKFGYHKPMLNKKHSKETKEKISKSMKKKFQDNPEIIEKISETLKNRVVSDITRKKLSEINKGKNHWNSKKYLIKFINGRTYLVLNGYKKFCKEFNLTQYGFQKCLEKQTSFKNIEFVKYYKDGEYFDYEW